MSNPLVQALVSRLATFPGVQGCALVDADTGMVWYYAGQLPGIERLGEASVEFWRVQLRQSSYFEQFGPLESAAHSFAGQVIALFPCSGKPPLIAVCVADKAGMAWGPWGVKLAELKQVLKLAHKEIVA
jgi:hypothetical protein